MNSIIIQPRRTVIEDEVSSLKIDEMELVTKEQVMLFISREGYLKRVGLKSFNAGKNIGLKDNDANIFSKEVSTLDKILIFTNLGNFISFPVFKIAECKLKDIGTYISTLVQMNPKEKFIKAYCLSELNPQTNVLMVTSKGNIKQVMLSDFEINRYTKPVKGMKISQDEELVSVDMINNPLEIMVFTKRAEALRFRATDVSIYGTNAGGVKSINLKPKDEVVNAIYTNKNDDFILLTNRLTLKRMKVSDVPLTKRARAGSCMIKPLKTNPYLVVQAAKLTPNQYKENTPINLVYKNGNDIVESFSLKYNVSDCGRSIQSENPDLNVILGMYMTDPVEPDQEVSGDYLIEVKETLFGVDDGAVNETPLKQTKKDKQENANILDELNDILFKETGIKQTNYLRPEVDDSDSKQKDIEYKKISLFDE